MSRKLLYCGIFFPKLWSGLGVKLWWLDDFAFESSVSSAHSICSPFLFRDDHWLSADSLPSSTSLVFGSFPLTREPLHSQAFLKYWKKKKKKKYLIFQKSLPVLFAFRRFDGDDCAEWFCGTVGTFISVTVLGGGGGGTTGSKCSLILDFSIDGLRIMPGTFVSGISWGSLGLVEASLTVLVA